MIELFSQGDTSSSFELRKQEISRDISMLSDEKIINSNIDEWCQYYYDKFQIEPIELYVDNITQDIQKTTIETPNPFYSHNSYDNYEAQYFNIEGYKIKFTIPFDGESDLLKLRPSSGFFMTRFYVDNIISSTDDNLGKILYSFDFQKSDIENKENPKQIVESTFNSEFNNYKTTISRLNDEVNSFNNTLLSFIKSKLEERKQKAHDFITISEKLNIPLHLNSNIPNTIPIILKRKSKKIPQIPSQKPLPKEYSISDVDYQNIKNIINISCNSMEKAARTFIKLEEEELRDNILAFLNSHYIGMATGETFSKVGKTDINIRFENKSAYIAECKIWHGSKKFEDALLQLFSYTTWRDSKTSLIVFNKDNKDFNKVLNTIGETIENNDLRKSMIQIQKNEWQCVFNKCKDSTEEVDVQIVTFDLYI